MRLLDRYIVRQIVPVWCWCLAIFIFLVCLVDLFGHLDEILRFRIAPSVVLTYYLNFAPQVVVEVSPLALLIGAAFLTTRLARHQELLAMNASGTSLMRSAVPFLFLGWITSLLVFTVNDRIVPQTTAVYERLRRDVFRGPAPDEPLEQVAILDTFNRLYHARALDLEQQELSDLTVLEHDWHNRPTKSLHASRAVWTPNGWLLLYGTIYRLDEAGHVRGSPQPFAERLIAYPVTPESFREPEATPKFMPFAQLRRLISHLERLGMTNVRHYTVELASKLSLPFMNVVACLIGFVVSTQTSQHGHLRGLGMSVVWGACYYVVVGVGQAIGKDGLLPPIVAVWLPHLVALWWCVRRLRLAR